MAELQTDAILIARTGAATVMAGAVARDRQSNVSSAEIYITQIALRLVLQELHQFTQANRDMDGIWTGMAMGERANNGV